MCSIVQVLYCIVLYCIKVLWLNYYCNINCVSFDIYTVVCYTHQVCTVDGSFFRTTHWVLESAYLYIRTHENTHTHTHTHTHRLTHTHTHTLSLTHTHTLSSPETAAVALKRTGCQPAVSVYRSVEKTDTHLKQITPPNLTQDQPITHYRGSSQQLAGRKGTRRDPLGSIKSIPFPETSTNLLWSLGEDGD